MKATTKQTAVEFLVDKLSYSTSDGTIISHHKIITNLVEQAKAMEKEQIMNAVYDSMGTNFDPNMGRAELYYNETFKSE